MPNTVKHYRKSKLAGGGARDDAEATSWRALCGELKILNFKLEKSFVFSKSSFFCPLWQHFGGRIGGRSDKRQKNST